MSNSRIYFSPPFTDRRDLEEITKALASGWVSPMGPQLDEFEYELKVKFGYPEVLAVNSGTSALHLAVKMAGILPGDHVLVGSFTFIAVANVLFYEQAIPVLVDSDSQNWNVSPELLQNYLSEAKVKPKALIVTHIFGIPACMDRIQEICEAFDVVLIEDAAEALGSQFDGKNVGTFGKFGALSFNGNKIITTSGGGALICSSTDRERAYFLATQSKERADHYSHREVGYNYRMSNLLAGLGLAQLEKFQTILKKKNSLHEMYRSQLNHGEVKFYQESAQQFFNHWITPVLLDGVHPSDAVRKFDECNIEVRRFWKPLHLQPSCKTCVSIGGEVSQGLFDRGICLPGGVGMTDEEISRVTEVLLML